MAALDLDPIRERLAAATPGPWENDGGGEIGQHWSRPEPWERIVSTEVVCGSYCYGGSSAGVERDEDANFIAHAPTDIAALVAEIERLRGRLADPDCAADPTDAEVAAAAHAVWASIPGINLRAAEKAALAALRAARAA